MIKLITYFNCGYCEKAKDGMVYFKVTKLTDNYEKILPFFSIHPLYGVKATDYQDWCKVAELLKIKAHLTREGARFAKLDRDILKYIST